MNGSFQITRNEAKAIEASVGPAVMKLLTSKDKYCPNEFITLCLEEKNGEMFLGVSIKEGFSVEMLKIFIPKILELCSMSGNSVKLITTALGMAKHAKSDYQKATTLSRMHSTETVERKKFGFRK